MHDWQRLLVCLLAMVPVGWGDSQCPPGQAALYKLTFQGLWSRMLFPKHYPLYRPHAHWSKVMGRTHGPEEVMWRMKEMVSKEFREFVESGHTSRLDLRTQGQGDIHDLFQMPKLNKGVGVLQSKFIADSEHSQLSLAAKLIPSPDWFVGLDSLSLCQDGQWLDKKSLPLKPLDAGTQRGVMFSSPKWPEAKQKAVSEILYRPPAHQASSFFYPQKRRLPPIAKVILMREKVYNGELNDKVVKSARRQERVKDQPVTAMTSTQRATTSSPQTRDCVLSEWSDWTACSKTCGFGKIVRKRYIIQQPQPGGAPCVQRRIQAKTCGSMRKCKWSYFSNDRWRSAKTKQSSPSRLQRRRRYRRRPRRRHQKKAKSS